jgi:hypothetical protein
MQLIRVKNNNNNPEKRKQSYGSTIYAREKERRDTTTKSTGLKTAYRVEYQSDSLRRAADLHVN